MSNSFAGKTYALFLNNGNRRIVSRLVNAGAKIIEFPFPEAKALAIEDTNEIATNLKNFDWIIFSDVLTVDFFLEILEKNAIDFFDLDDVRICALGEVVSDRLRFAQIHADVIPNTVESEDVLFALQSYIAPDKVKNLKYLFINQNHTTSELKGKLTELGGEVFELPVYQVDFSNEVEIPKLKALVKGGAIDEFIFCAATDFIALGGIFRNESLAEIFSEIKIIAVDGLMYQTIRENKLKPDGLFQPDKIDKV